MAPTWTTRQISCLTAQVKQSSTLISFRKFLTFVSFQLSTKMIRFSKSAYPNVSFTSNERLFLMAEVCFSIRCFVLSHSFSQLSGFHHFVGRFWGGIAIPSSHPSHKRSCLANWPMISPSCALSPQVPSRFDTLFWHCCWSTYLLSFVFYFYWLDETEQLWERMDFAMSHVAKRRGEGTRSLSCLVSLSSLFHSKENFVRYYVFLLEL